MNLLTEIPMESDWSYLYEPNTTSDYSPRMIDKNGWITLPTIGDWVVSNGLNAGADWFRRTVNLEPAELCVRYHLRIERVPEHVTAYVNGVEVGTANHNENLHVDVTNQVSLGDNLFALKLVCTDKKAGGAFKRVYLEQLACD